MMKSLLVVLMLLASPSQALLFDEAAAKSVTVLVQSINADSLSQGTGIYIGEGKILTDAHVVRSTNVVVFDLTEDDLMPATVVFKDEEKDIAILSTEIDNTYFAVFSQEVVIGSTVLVVGNPIDNDFETTKAKIVGITFEMTPLGQPRHMITIRGKGLRPGYSGGALFSAHGAVLGTLEICRINPEIPDEIWAQSENTCYAIMSKELLQNVKGLSKIATLK